MDGIRGTQIDQQLTAHSHTHKDSRHSTEFHFLAAGPSSHQQSKTALERRLVFSSLLAFVLFVVFAVVNYEATSLYTSHNDYREDSATDFLRVLAMLLTLTQVVLLCNYHAVHNRYTKLFTNSRGEEKYLGLEIALHLLVLPPRVNFDFEVRLIDKDVKLALSDFFAVVSTFRAYSVVRMFFWQLRNSRGRARIYT